MIRCPECRSTRVVYRAGHPPFACERCGAGFVPARPIIFSAPMIRALLDGRKTQHRLPMRQMNRWQVQDCREVRLHEGHWCHFMKGAGLPMEKLRVPRVGDRLWVREAWSEEHPIAVQPDRYSQPGRSGISGPPSVHYRVVYRADGEPLQVWRRDEFPYFGLGGPRDDLDAAYPTVVSNFTREGRGVHWLPARVMPRLASRLTLTVTDLRVQRLQEICEEDAKAEGAIRAVIDDEGRFYESATGDYRTGFAGLWTHHHGRSPWDANSWVTALTFTVERRNVDEVG